MAQLVAFIILMPFCSVAQQESDFVSAINNDKLFIQARHYYPTSKLGDECHWVEVTGFSIYGEDIKIIESWENFWGSKAKTTLIGKVKRGIAAGTWSSNYSNGHWKYDFNSGIGSWNKTKTSFGTKNTFTDFLPLEFEIIESKPKDGRYPCQ